MLYYFTDTFRLFEGISVWYLTNLHLLTFIISRGNAATILEKMVKVLPGMAEAMSTPLQQTEKMVFLSSGGNCRSSGGGGGGDMDGVGTAGASAFMQDFRRALVEVPEAVHALTGVDIRAVVQNMGNGQTGKAMAQGFAEGVASSIAERSIDGIVQHAINGHGQIQGGERGQVQRQRQGPGNESTPTTVRTISGQMNEESRASRDSGTIDGTGAANGHP